MTLYDIEEYEMATRSFLKVREIREKLFGIEHTDTAATLNNLGCCLFMLDRSQEAMAYFKIAYSIFEAELGLMHNRS